MKKPNLYGWLFLLALASQSGFAQSTAAVVAPPWADMVSSFPNIRDVTISMTEDEIYFTAQSPLGELSAIVVLVNVDGVWSAPEAAPFSGQYHDLEPFLSPDGLRLFFVSNRPLMAGDTLVKDYDIWWVERPSLRSDWSAPQNLGSPVNTAHDEFYPAVTRVGHLYFTSDRPEGKGKDDIYRSQWLNGSYQVPQLLPDSVNTNGYEFNAYVSPDESILLFTGYQRAGGYGSGDLYLCRAKADGSWTSPVNLGEDINSPYMDYCPFVHPVSQALYFTSKRSAMPVRFDKPQALETLRTHWGQYANGQSRLYQMVNWRNE